MEGRSSYSKRFSDLIRSHRQVDKQLSENSRDVLHEAVFQLITLHQNTPSLVEEVLQTSHDKASTAAVHEEGRDSVLLSNVFNSLSQLESQPNHSVTLTVTESCARRMIQCGLSDTNSNSASQSDIKRDSNLHLCIQQIRSLIKQQKFNRQHFVGLLTKEGFLSLQTLWCLHNEDILTVTDYITRKMSHSGFVKSFSCSLYRLWKSTGQDQDNLSGSSCLSGILSILINGGFPEKKEKEVSWRKVAVAVLDETIRGILDNVDDSCRMKRFIGMTYMEDSLNSVSFKKYCTHTLSLLMSHKPSLKVSQAFKQQTNWKFAKVSDQISDLYKQLFLPFKSREILEVLQRILERQEVNWQTVLSFIATFLVCYPDAAKLIQGHVYELLSQGLESADMESTIVGFLLARQSCLEGLHVFPPYQDWFLQTFSDSTRTPASTRKSFTFLMKFLTNIVPYESAQHLKVHILRPPHVPAKCRPLLAEYIILAKTRLTDLKESCEIIGGIYDSTSSTDSKQTDPVESDVERSLAAFQATGKVPSTVMEASIFRKPYFVGKYLEALLTPRHRPDKPDTRMKMIESLKKADKIPASMYSKYEEACRKESKQLLEGVFEEDSEDDTMQDAMLSPLSQLQYRLEQLHNTVVSQETDVQHNKGKVSEIVSIISDKLDNLLPPGQTVQSETPQVVVQSEEENRSSCEIIINLEQPELTRHQIDVVDSLLNGVCRTVTSDLVSDSPMMCWLTQVLKMVSQHKSIHQPLVQRISTLILTQGTALSQQHLVGLSALVGQISSLQPQFGTITFKCSGSTHRYTSSTFVDGLIHCIQMKSGHHINFALRFLTSYLEYTFLQYQCYGARWSSEDTGVIPHHLVKLFCMLCWRLLQSTRGDSGEPQEKDVAATIFSSSKYKELLKESQENAYKSPKEDVYLIDLKPLQVSPEDWVRFEIDIYCEEDTLPYSERQDYYNWAVYRHFLGTQTMDNSIDINTMCSVLLDSLVRKKVISTASVQPSSCRKCHKGDNSNRDNSSDMLLLLQALLAHLPPCTVVPWLVNHLQSAVQRNSVDDVAASADVSTQALVVTVFSYVCRLPPYLLFVNRATDTPTQQNISSVLALFENILAPNLSESCYLPTYLTLYLLQGILTMRHGGVDDSLLKQLLLHPLVGMSVMVHWPQVLYILQTGGIEEADSLFSDFYNCMTWANRCVETRDSTLCPSEPWLCASSLFSLGLTQADSIVIIGDVLAASARESQVVSVYMELCLMYLAAGYMDTKTQKPAAKVLWTVVPKLIQTFPELIPRHRQESLLETRVASLSARSLRKPVLLKVVSQLNVQDYDSVLSNSPDILACMLELYSLTSKQFEHANNSQCISLVQLSECAIFLKTVLNTVSVKCLQSLDQGVLLSAGPDFHHLVMSRLRSDR